MTGGVSSWLARFFPGQNSLVWKSAAASHQGCVRELNEDGYLNQPELQLWAVADGMGGHEAGEVASQHIIETLARMGTAPGLSEMVSLISSRLDFSNAELRKLAAQKGPNTIIGATVVSMVARDNGIVCQWAGDSRLYRLRNMHLEQLTSDHDLLTEMRSQSASEDLIRTVQDSNAITRAVGADDNLKLDKVALKVEPNDTFMLCSDGLYREVSNPMIAGLLKEHDPVRAANMLVESALAAGGRDNITVVVVQARASAK